MAGARRARGRHVTGSEITTKSWFGSHSEMVVEELELSSRTLNCLKRAGLNRVGEVLEKSKDELLEIRNFGEKSYTELYDKFREIGVLPEHLDPDNDSEENAENTSDSGESE